MDEYYCTNCGAALNDQDGFNPNKSVWVCTECGTTLMGDDIYNGDCFQGVAWYCDNCNALLNKQVGFTDLYGTWTYTKCGHSNGTTEDDIVNLDKNDNDEQEDNDDKKCPICGDILTNQWSFNDNNDFYTCSCCNTRLHKDYLDNYSVIYDEENYICPNCGEWLPDQALFNDYCDDYTCMSCGAKLHRNSSFNPYSVVDDDSSDASFEEKASSKESSYSGNSDSINYYEPRHSNSKRNIVLPFIKRHWKGVAITVLIIVLALWLAYLYFENQKLKDIGYDSESLIGVDYHKVVSGFENLGFTKVSASPEFDLTIEDIDLEGTVKTVIINGNDHFNSTTRYPYDSKIEIIYHVLKNISVTISSNDAKSLHYRDLFMQLKNAGFVNITLSPKDDLIFGILIKDGSVESITINGDNSFNALAEYRPDAEIIITYHNYKP